MSDYRLKNCAFFRQHAETLKHWSRNQGGQFRGKYSAKIGRQVIKCFSINVSHYSLMSSDIFCDFNMIIFTIANCFTGHPVNFVEYHSMGVPLVLCQHRLHPHSEWSSMRSGAKGIGNVLWGPFCCYRWLPTIGKFPFHANLSLAGLIYENSCESM